MNPRGARMVWVTIIPAVVVAVCAAGTAFAAGHGTTWTPRDETNAAPGSTNSHDHEGKSVPKPSGNVSVSIPPVVFVASITAPGGTLHMPVVLTDPSVTARAFVMPGNRCAVTLTQGVPAWVDCSVRVGDRVVVKTSDHRTFTKAITVT